MRELMYAMMKQNTLLKVGLEAAQEEVAEAQRTTIAVAERMSAPLVQDLSLTSFWGTGTLLGAEEWLNDVENLLEVVYTTGETDRCCEDLAH